jgi:hypothetical protein
LLAKTLDKTTLQNLIERNDGNVIGSLDPPQRTGAGAPAGFKAPTPVNEDRIPASDGGQGSTTKSFNPITSEPRPR